MPCIDFSLSERQGKTFCRRCAGQGERRQWETHGGQAPRHQGTAPSDRVLISTRVKDIGSRPVINRISFGAMWNHSRKEEQENRKKKVAGGGRGRPGAGAPRPAGRGRQRPRHRPGGRGPCRDPLNPPVNAISQKITTKWAAPPLPSCHAARHTGTGTPSRLTAQGAASAEPRLQRASEMLASFQGLHRKKFSVYP